MEMVKRHFISLVGMSILAVSFAMRGEGFGVVVCMLAAFWAFLAVEAIHECEHLRKYVDQLEREKYNRA